MALHVGLCYLLAVPLRLGGVAAAGSLAAAINVLLLYVLLRRRIGRLDTRRLLRSLVRTSVASLAMAAVIAVPLWTGALDTTSRLRLVAWILGVVGVAGVVYLLAARLLGSEELAEFGRLLGRRFRRRREG